MTPPSGTDQRLTGSGSPAAEFVTAEWEAAADWDVPAEWPPADPSGSAFFATGPQPLPDWLEQLTTPPPVQRRAPQPPLPRRRDVRRGTAEIPVVPTAPAEFAAPAQDVVGDALRARHAVQDREARDRDAQDRHRQEPELRDRVAPAGDPLPRRRDVHRRDRSERSAARRASVEAYTETLNPSSPTVRASTLPVAAARVGVVSVLVAVGAGVVGGEHLDLVGQGAELTAAEGATALSLAPLPSDPKQLTIWDKSRDQEGLVVAAGKVAEARALREEKRRLKELAAKKKREAEKAAKLKAERAKQAAMRSAQRNPRAIARIMVRERGWSSGQFQCLNSLWQRESGWNYRIANRSSGAYGIPQALPGSKMASAGADWRTNPVTQIKWGLNYIASRYGTPCGAWAHSESRGWY